MLALLYVTVQFRLLDEQCPDLGKSAVVDDRSLRWKSEPVETPLEQAEYMQNASPLYANGFNQLHGHSTNLHGQE